MGGVCSLPGGKRHRLPCPVYRCIHSPYSCTRHVLPTTHHAQGFMILQNQLVYTAPANAQAVPRVSRDVARSAQPAACSFRPVGRGVCPPTPKALGLVVACCAAPQRQPQAAHPVRAATRASEHEAHRAHQCGSTRQSHRTAVCNSGPRATDHFEQYQDATGSTEWQMRAVRARAPPPSAPSSRPRSFIPRSAGAASRGAGRVGMAPSATRP